MNLSNGPDDPSLPLISATSSQNHKKSLNRKILLMAAIHGALFFFISAAGTEDLQDFFSLDEKQAMNVSCGLGAGASIINMMFIYKTLEHLTLKPVSKLSWCLAILSPFAASPFLTAGIVGAKVLSLQNEAAYFFGSLLFFFRNFNMIDGAAKFPERYEDIKHSFQYAIARKRGVDLFRVLITLYISVGYTVSTTDSIYAAFMQFGNWIDLTPSNVYSAICYTATILGAVGLFPMTLYWTQRGINQLTNAAGGDPSAQEKDPTDTYTMLSLPATAPIILSMLGSTTTASGQVFGQLGTFSKIIRISSSIGYGVCAGVPGLATLFRSIPSYLNSLKSTTSQQQNKSPYQSVDDAASGKEITDPIDSRQHEFVR